MIFQNEELDFELYVLVLIFILVGLFIFKVFTEPTEHTARQIALNQCINKSTDIVVIHACGESVQLAFNQPTE